MQPLALLQLVLFGRELLGPGRRVVDDLREQHRPTCSQRPACPPEMQRRGMTVPDRLLPRGSPVDGLQRKGDFDEFLAVEEHCRDGFVYSSDSGSCAGTPGTDRVMPVSTAGTGATAGCPAKGPSPGSRRSRRRRCRKRRAAPRTTRPAPAPEKSDRRSAAVPPSDVLPASGAIRKRESAGSPLSSRNIVRNSTLKAWPSERRPGSKSDQSASRRRIPAGPAGIPIRSGKPSFPLSTCSAHVRRIRRRDPGGLLCDRPVHVEPPIPFLPVSVDGHRLANARTGEGSFKHLGLLPIAARRCMSARSFPLHVIPSLRSWARHPGSENCAAALPPDSSGADTAKPRRRAAPCPRVPQPSEP